MKTIRWLWLVSILLLLVASGCTAEGEPVSLLAPAGGEPPATPPDMGLPPGGSEGEVVEPPTAEDEVVVSSEGETFTGGAAGGESTTGRVSGQDVSTGKSDKVVFEDEATWQVYRSETYGFQVRYPPAYVVLPEAEPTGVFEESQPLAEVRFQDKALARGETAAMEPPQFAVRVYPNPAGLSAEAWVQERAEGGDWTISTYLLGDVQGVEMVSQTLMAPGRFIYLARGSYIYELVPMGSYANRMLASFAFTQ